MESTIDATTIVELLVSAGYVRFADVPVGSETGVRAWLSGGVRVVLVRACDVQGAPIEGVQTLPQNGKPVATRGDLDAAWTEVVRALGEIPLPSADAA